MGLLQYVCLSIILIFAPATFARGLPDAAAAVETAPLITAALFRQSPSPNESRLERFTQSVKVSKLRHQAIASRILSAAAANTSTGKDLVTPVSALPNIGEYGMILNVGTPPITVNGLADTGSDLIWGKCAPYTGTTGVGPIFNPKASTTYKTISCQDQKCANLESLQNCGTSSSCGFQEQYGDGTSISGDFATETITLSGLDGKPQAINGISIGCIHTGSKEIEQLPGLIGLGGGKVSLVSQLGSSIQRMFSYCLLGLDAPPNATSKLVFGASAALQGPGIQVIPLTPNLLTSTYYTVDLQAVGVAGSRIPIPPSFLFPGAILDSGTTVTFLQPAVSSKVVAAFKSLVHLPAVDYSSQGFTYCVDTSAHSNYQFPSFTLYFGNAVSITLAQTNYFVNVDNAKPNVYCLVVLASPQQAMGLQIIGNIMQQNYQLLYDLGKSEVSWKPANCDSL